MALSQIQCLDDNHVNWRVSEAKPEFFYSEEQRVALEALVSGGREAFCAFIKERGMRLFLSEPELQRLSRAVEDYRPGAEVSPAADPEERALSLQYWPDRSDVSIPDLDLGWPDTNAYRGVTRVNVYTQPPVDGQTHIKEVVRKAIAQAQKVVAVVMDVFTDVDIFKDLLDAGFKRRVAVYIIIEKASIQDFLHMCERAGMHGGHLKFLRVRYSGGSEFLTRSAKKIQGSLSQKFMFVDGDRAISGSYSFTWTASRFDRNLITVLTGQAVETFDKQFRELYSMSNGVSLSKVPLTEVPEPEPLPLPAPAAVPSAAVARKLINPKYALVDTASRTSSDKTSPKNSNSPNGMPIPVKRQREIVDNSPKHPGLIGLPRAELISYLPTWPEPDPPSDVIGFINIRDTSKPLQVHLMRSQLFETSQAIRFKDPFTAPPKEPLPEKACPRAKTSNTPGTNHIQGKPETKVPLVPPQENTQPDPLKMQNPLASSSNISPPTAQQPPLEAAPTGGNPSGPPVPKPRTLQLVMTAKDNVDDIQVSLVKRNEVKSQETSSSEEYGEAPEDPNLTPAKSELECPTQTKNTDTSSTEVVDSALERDEGSTASDEYYECNDLDKLPNGRLPPVSGHLKDHGTMNLMARISQSMVDLRPDKTSELDPAERNLLNIHSRYAGKVYQAVARSPVRESYSRAKVVIAKPGVYHRSPKSSAHVIGGHRYWQGKLSSTQMDAHRSGRSPSRKTSPNKLGSFKNSHSPIHHMSHTQSPSPRRRNEMQPPTAISLTKLASYQNMRSRGDQRVPHRHKES